MWDTPSIIIGIIFTIFILLIAISYWQFTLFVVGVILINLFTFWAAIAVFLMGMALQAYDKVQNKVVITRLVINEIMANSVKLTLVVVIAAIVINFIFQAMGKSDGYIPCTRSTPHGC